MPTTLVLVRHGEMPINREENYNKLIKDHYDGPLSERGIAEVEVLGKVFRGEKFSRIYASEFIRTQETAAIILKHSKDCSNLKIVVDKRISERDAGIWKEKTPLDMVKAAMAAGVYPHFLPCEGGETVEEVMRRAGNFLKEMCDLADNSSENESQIVLAATHGAWLASFMEHILTSPNLYKVENCNEKLARSPAPTTGVTKIVNKEHK
jgi:broad specificity phosphatase PhoE